MGKMRFLTVMIPAVAIVAALSLPAAAQTGAPGQPTGARPAPASVNPGANPPPTPAPGRDAPATATTTTTTAETR